MSSKRTTTLGVIFGGRSVEHDVSIVTGHQIIRALEPERYQIVPIYIDRAGRWLSGEPLLNIKNFESDILTLDGVEEVVLSPNTNHHGLIVNPIGGGFFAKPKVIRLDVIFPALHGTHGEDGTIQGLFELADIPYVGCGVLASALANDKVMTKVLLRQHGISVLDALSFSRAEWTQSPDKVIEHITSVLKFPIYIKPATLGSSIGITRANDAPALRAAIDMATHFDRRVLVEQALTDCVEINCALMGNDDDIKASVLEQPITYDEFLSFEKKYLQGGEGMKSAERIIPAPLSPQIAAQVQEIAIRAFQAIDGRGTARIDFLVKGEEIYLNEVNTLPGSLAFYLWHEMGMPAREVVHKLIALAQDAHAEKRRSTYDYKTNLVAQTAQRGLKGAKGKTRQSSG